MLLVASESLLTRRMRKGQEPSLFFLMLILKGLFDALLISSKTWDGLKKLTLQSSPISWV